MTSSARDTATGLLDAVLAQDMTPIWPILTAHERGAAAERLLAKSEFAHVRETLTVEHVLDVADRYIADQTVPAPSLWSALAASMILTYVTWYGTWEWWAALHETGDLHVLAAELVTVGTEVVWFGQAHRPERLGVVVKLDGDRWLIAGHATVIHPR